MIPVTQTEYRDLCNARDERDLLRERLARYEPIVCWALKAHDKIEAAVEGAGVKYKEDGLWLIPMLHHDYKGLARCMETVPAEMCSLIGAEGTV